MEIGLRISDLVDVEEKIKQTSEMGIHYCQLCSFDTSFYTDAYADKILNACAKYNVKISTYWAGWSGPNIWNFTEGPVTLGLLPAAYRRKRIAELKQGADFAKKLHVDQVATHVGFIPENPHDIEFAGLMDAVREVAHYCSEKGLFFLFETGQETPVALMRAIEVIGLDNLGINLDTANPILYGKSNPVDMLKILGKYVRDIHVKDGKWPTDGWNLGAETVIGEGDVDFQSFIKILKEIGYNRTLTIEREIEGEQQIKDIIRAKEFLEKILADES